MNLDVEVELEASREDVIEALAEMFATQAHMIDFLGASSEEITEALILQAHRSGQAATDIAENMAEFAARMRQ